MRLSETKPPSAREVKEAEARFRKREIWGGAAGVVAIAVVLTATVFGIAFATYSQYDPKQAAAEGRFGQCYSGVPNCVVDGDTFQAKGEKVQIAGIAAPQIVGAKCDAERSRGIDAATRLAELLNSGNVTAGPTFRDDFGRAVRKVKVEGQDIAPTLIGEGVVREASADGQDWC